jgi:hypothetical protein
MNSWGMKGYGVYRRSFVKDQRLVGRAPICVYLLHFANMRKKIRTTAWRCL